METKTKIFNAAAEIIKTKGFAYLTISNICKVAGVSNGTFFYHFKTKDDLLSAYTFERFARFREERQFEATVESYNYIDKIIEFYGYWADYMEEMGLELASNFYNTKNTSLNNRLWNKRQPLDVWDYPGQVMRDAFDVGLLKTDKTADHYSEVIITMMKGVAFDWCLSEAAFNMRERIREIMLPYLRSISVPTVE